MTAGIEPIRASRLRRITGAPVGFVRRLAHGKPSPDLAAGPAIERRRRYRCLFLSSTGVICAEEACFCAADDEAVAMALRLWRSKPCYYGFELWRGTVRLHVDIRMPEPSLAFVIRAPQASVRENELPANIP